jgi:hypothetical protein
MNWLILLADILAIVWVLGLLIPALRKGHDKKDKYRKGK